MSNGSAWQQEALAFKQIPTLQALLRCCDERLLVRVIVDEHVARAGDWETLSSKRKRAVEKRLTSTVSTMRSLPVNKKRKRAGLLLPSESFVLHGRSGLLERRMGAALMSLDDAVLARRALEDRTSGVYTSGKASSLEESGGPSPRHYTLAPWETTLVRRVWLGGLRCCRERYLVLAAAFWEMTYLGFEYERVCARQAERKARHLLEAPVKSSFGEDSDDPPRADCRHQAAAFGLTEPDHFELDYRDSLAMRVAELNRGCEQELWALLVDVAHRLGKI